MSKDLLINNDQEVFTQTLKRACYILINNWDRSQKGAYIQQLVESFEDPSIGRYALGTMTQRLRYWLRDFKASQEYQNLRLFASRFEGHKKSWSDRYAHYQLINQAEDQNNSAEQREAARTLTERVRHRFRLDLALYVSRQQQAKPLSQPSAITSQLSHPATENPTGLGETTLNLIKSLVMRRGLFSPNNLARIFLDQVQDLSYLRYKSSLLNYLVYSSDREKKQEEKGFLSLLRMRLNDRLNTLYMEWEEEVVTEELMLRSCNQIISFLTTENSQVPSQAFMLFISQGHSLLLAIVLLKLILVSPASRTHLDLRIAKLVQYYTSVHQEQEPKKTYYFGHFLDIINVTLAIYAEGVNYNLIQNKPAPSTPSEPALNSSPSSPLPEYRIFSQIKGQKIRATENSAQGNSQQGNSQQQEVSTPIENPHSSPSLVVQTEEQAIVQPVSIGSYASPMPSLRQSQSSKTILFDAVTGEEIVFEEEVVL